MEVEEGIRGVLARLHVTCRGHVNAVALGGWGVVGDRRAVREGQWEKKELKRGSSEQEGLGNGESCRRTRRQLRQTCAAPGRRGNEQHKLSSMRMRKQIERQRCRPWAE